MGAEIDRLEIQVEAQARKASHQIDTLIGKLSRLSGVLSGVNSGGFSNMAAGVRNLSAAMKTMEGIKTSDFTRVSKGIQELSKLNTTNLYRASNAIRNFSNSMSRMSGLSTPQIEVKNIDSIGKTMKKLDGIDTTNASQSADSIKNIADAMTAFNGVNVSNTGVTNFTNALRRMLSIDLSKFDSGEFSKIAQSMSLLGSMPDVSNSLNRFVSSLARLSGTGDSMFTTAKALPELSSNLSKTIKTISGAGDISDSTNMFVQSIGRLAAAGNKTNQTASGLENLANETVHFMNILSTAPSVNQSVVNMVQALAQLASAGGKAGSAANSLNGLLGKLSGSASFTGKTMKSMASTTISAFSKVTGTVSKVTVSLTKLTVAMLNPVGTAKRMGSAVASAFEKIGIGSKHIDTATFSLKNLFRAIIPLMGVRQLFNWGKQAVEISSDLTEVQNVVDTTFGDFKQKIEDFASVSIQDYGMSELTSKQIASRFQAMGVAMGFSQGKMSDMSVELTKLAADMASFYNVEQSDVAESLESIFTGQTRPLRQYGLDLTQATVQEWAMKQGIDANMQSMSQVSKTLLRYQYVLANTTAAQGDFARTSNTWANQTRILGQSFQVLGSTIGEVLINAFKPLVSWLNNVMLKVISVVETIGNALGAIFGWTIEVSSGGATSGYDDMADGIGSVGDAADGAGSSLGNAADKAKELKAALMGFDEINKLPDYSDVSTGSGGSGGNGAGSGSGGGTSGTAQIVRTDSVLEKYKSEINSLEELGSYIGEKLTAAMNSIPWEDVYSAADNFGTGLAEFLNGLISPGLFNAIGTTVAGCLNTALHGLDSFGETFEWDNFGESLGTGFDTFMKTFDMTLAADTASKFTNGIATAVITGSEAVSWGKIGDKIATSMNTYLKTVSWSTVGEAVSTGINTMFKLAETWSGKFDFDALGDAVKTSVKSALSSITWTEANTSAKKIGNGIAKAINKVMDTETFGIIGETIASSINTVVSGAYEFIGTVEWEEWGNTIANSINKFFSKLDWKKSGLTFSKAVEGILNTLSSAITGISWDSAGDSIATALKAVNWSEILSSVGTVIANTLSGLVDFAGALFKGLTQSDFDVYLENTDNAIKKMQECNDEIVKRIENADKWKIAGEEEAGIAEILAEDYFNLAEKQGKSAEEKEKLKDMAKKLVETLPDLEQYYNSETGLLDTTRESVDNLIESLKAKAKTEAAQDALKEYYATQLEAKKVIEESSKKAEELAGKEQNLALKYSDSMAALEKLNKEYANGTISEEEYQKKVVALTKASDGCGAKLGEVRAAQEENNAAMEKAKAAYENAGAKIDDATSYMMTYSSETDTASQKTDTLSQKLSNISKEAEITISVKGMDASFDEKIKVIAEVTGTDYSNMPVSEKFINDCYAEIVSSYQKKGFKPDLTSSSTIDSAVQKKGYKPNIDANGTIGYASQKSGYTPNVTAKAEMTSSKDSLSKEAKTFKTAAHFINKTNGLTNKQTTFESTANFTGRINSIASKYKDSEGRLKFSSNANITARTNNIGSKYRDSKGRLLITSNANIVKAHQGYENNKKPTISAAGSIISAWQGYKNDKKPTVSAAGSIITAWQGYKDSNKPGINVHGNVTSGSKVGQWGIKLAGSISLAGLLLSAVLKKSGGVFSGGSWHPITAAANGGSFNMGQMFIAREAGPELVGTLGGHTAVMNNDQIVASVSAGVYQAVSAAMSQFGQNSSGGTPVFNIYVGGKKVTDVVVEEVNRRTMATGICPIMT